MSSDQLRYNCPFVPLTKKNNDASNSLFKYYTCFHTYIFSSSVFCEGFISVMFSDLDKNKLTKLLENRKTLSTTLEFPFCSVRPLWFAEAQKFPKVIVLPGIIGISFHTFWSRTLRKSHSILGNCSKHIFVIELIEFWAYRYRCFSLGGISTKLSCFNCIQTLKYS